MRVATLNINNINKRLANLLDWLAIAQPHVVCLQELKCEDRAFPQKALAAAGYGSVWQGERSWNGVAILARDTEPVLTRLSLPGDETDKQARYIEAAVSGVLFASIYAPNGNPQPGPKFDYKLAWLKRLVIHAQELMAANVPVVLAGDYNIVPTEADIYRCHHEQKNALLQPAARDVFRHLLEQGWVDALRVQQPEGPLWTFWSYLRERWASDKGMRLDHLLLSPAIAPSLLASGVSQGPRAEEGASDHAPAWIQLKSVPELKARAQASASTRRRDFNRAVAPRDAWRRH